MCLAFNANSKLISTSNVLWRGDSIAIWRNERRWVSVKPFPLIWKTTFALNGFIVRAPGTNDIIPDLHKIIPEDSETWIHLESHEIQFPPAFAEGNCSIVTNILLSLLLVIVIVICVRSYVTLYCAFLLLCISKFYENDDLTFFNGTLELIFPL